MYIRALATGLCGFFLLTPVHAQEPPSPCGSPVAVPDKPLLEDYPDYSDFLLQIMKYKQAQRDQAAHRNACPDDYIPQPMASSDPTVIDEPETLSSALVRAKQLPTMDYQKNGTWHDRSTSRSFTLPALPGTSMASESIRTVLSNTGSQKPLVLPMTIVGMQLDGLNDGENSSNVALDAVYQTLFNEEQKTGEAYRLANTPNEIVQLGSTGNLLFFLNRDLEPVLTTGVVHTVSCLSSNCPNSP